MWNFSFDLPFDMYEDMKLVSPNNAGFSLEFFYLFIYLFIVPFPVLNRKQSTEDFKLSVRCLGLYDV